jgi:hypothetical protein
MSTLLRITTLNPYVISLELNSLEDDVVEGNMPIVPSLDLDCEMCLGRDKIQMLLLILTR